MTSFLLLQTLIPFGSRVSSERSEMATSTLIRSLKESFVDRISVALASSFVKKQFSMKTSETIPSFCFFGSLTCQFDLLPITTFVFVWSSMQIYILRLGQGFDQKKKSQLSGNERRWIGTKASLCREKLDVVADNTLCRIRWPLCLACK